MENAMSNKIESLKLQDINAKIESKNIIGSTIIRYFDRIKTSKS